MSTLSALVFGKNLEFEENYLQIHPQALHIDQWVKISIIKKFTPSDFYICRNHKNRDRVHGFFYVKFFFEIFGSIFRNRLFRVSLVWILWWCCTNYTAGLPCIRNISINGLMMERGGVTRLLNKLYQALIIYKNCRYLQ